MTPRRIARTFISGLVTLLPVLITLAILVWLVKTADTVLDAMVSFILPGEVHSRGFGLIVAIGVIFGTGLLMEGILFQRLLNWLEEWINKIPLVKTIYGPARDLMSLLSKGSDKKFSKVVMVRLPGTQIQALGFVTVEDFSASSLSPGQDVIAVYLPMSYQIGGYTLFLPRDCLTAVDMSLEVAMRFVVTAGMSRSG
jgi:uncharacterized membrane protein